MYIVIVNPGNDEKRHGTYQSATLDGKRQRLLVKWSPGLTSDMYVGDRDVYFYKSRVQAKKDHQF